MIELNSINKKNFKKIYYSNTNKEAAKKLGVCSRTIINYAKRLNVQMKGRGNFGENVTRTKIRIEE